VPYQEQDTSVLSGQIDILEKRDDAQSIPIAEVSCAIAVLCTLCGLIFAL
jgi:hypothetical protein